MKKLISKCIAVAMAAGMTMGGLGLVSAAWADDANSSTNSSVTVNTQPQDSNDPSAGDSDDNAGGNGSATGEAQNNGDASGGSADSDTNSSEGDSAQNGNDSNDSLAPQQLAPSASAAPQEDREYVPAPSQDQIDASGSDYQPGSGRLESHFLRYLDDETSHNDVIEVEPNKSVNLTSHISMASKQTPVVTATSVWLGYRLTLPKTTASLGTLEISSGTIKDLNTGSRTVSAKDDGNGNWVIEGRLKVTGSEDAIVMPGEFENSLSIIGKNVTDGDAVTIREDIWLWADGEQNTVNTTSRDIKFTAKPVFDLVGPGRLVTTDSDPWYSGYYNAQTKQFSLSKPAGDGWVYGRLYGVNMGVRPTSAGSERIDPTVPITWNITTQIKTTGGVDDTEENQPVLIGIRSATSPTTISQLATGVVTDDDMGLGIEAIAEMNVNSGNYPKSEGDNPPHAYSFSGDVNETSVSVKLADQNPADYLSAQVWAEYFVPVVTSDTRDTGRSFTIKVSDLTGKSMSGADLKDSDGANNVNTYPIGYLPEGEGGFNRITVATGWTGVASKELAASIPNYGSAYQQTKQMMANGEGSTMWSYLAAPGQTYEPNKTSSIRDYDVRAMNQLIKFDDAFHITGNPTICGVGLGMGSCGYLNETNGKRIEPNVLWAVKPDGSAWASDVERDQTQDYQLRYYPTKEAAAQAGTIVGVLIEFRGGIWSSGVFLGVSRIPYTLDGEPDTVAAVTTDYRVWTGNSVPGVDDTWKDTNGSAVAENTWGDTTIANNMLLLPWDDPNNTSAADPAQRSYMKDTWDDEAAAPKQNEIEYYGDSVRVIGAKVQVVNPSGSTEGDFTRILNGSDARLVNIEEHGGRVQKTFDVTSGNRIEDRVLVFDVTGKLSDEPLELKGLLNRADSTWAPRYPFVRGDKTYQYGEVLLDTPDNPVTYTPAPDPQKPGTFTGGTPVDPSNFSVPTTGRYRLYYRAYLGDESDYSKDVSIGSRYYNAGDLSIPAQSVRRAVMVFSNGWSNGEYITNIVGTARAGIQQSVRSPLLVENGKVTDQQSWNTTVETAGQNMINLYVLDVLPNNSDNRGTQRVSNHSTLSGEVTLTMRAQSGDAKSKPMRLFATTDVVNSATCDARSFGDTIAPSTRATSFETCGVTWTEVTVGEDGKYAIDTNTTALVWGTDQLAPFERSTVAIGLNLNQAHGDVLTNDASYSHTGTTDGALISNEAIVKVPTKSISGIAFNDVNRDGVYEAGIDKPIPGVTVELIDKDGETITANANGDAFGANQTARQSSSGVVTDEQGAYRFDVVPDGEVIAARFSGNTLSRFEKATKASGVSPEVSDTDSDVSADASGNYVTSAVGMSSYAQLAITGAASELAGGVNAGFVEPLRKVHADKVWVNGADSDHGEVKLQLQRSVDGGDPEKVGDVVTTKDLSYDWADLDRYDGNGKAYSYTVSEVDSHANYQTTVASQEDKAQTTQTFTFTNTYVVPTMDVSAQKVWVNGADADHGEVKLQLQRTLPGGTAENVGDVITTESLAHIWTGVPSTDIKGKPYTYSVKEIDTAGNYVATYAMGENDGSFTVTNTYVIPKISVTANKQWVDGADADHGEVQLQLQRSLPGGQAENIGDPVTTADHTYTWQDLDQTDDKANFYTYSVVEVQVPENYAVSYGTTADGSLTVTNTYVIPKRDVTAQKTWVDGADADHGEVKLQLQRSIAGGEVESVGDVVETSDLAYTWQGVDQTDSKGNVYTYSVVETQIPAHYEASYGTAEDGTLTVANTYVVPTMDITANKVWVDGTDSDHGEVRLQLQRTLNGGEPENVGDVVETSGLTYVWKGVPVTDSAAQPYAYTVLEVDVAGNYVASYAMGEQGDSFTVTNTYVIPKADVTANKVWVGTQHAQRPTIYFLLERSLDGKNWDAVPEVKPAELANGNTVAEWKDVEQTDEAGNAYTFRVREVNADGVDSVPNGYTKQENGLTVTNTEIPPVVVEVPNTPKRMANTGSQVGVLVAIAAMCLVVGAVVMGLRRNSYRARHGK